MIIKIIDPDENYNEYQAYADIDDRNGRHWFTVSATSKKSREDAVEKLKRVYPIELEKHQKERDSYKPPTVVVWNP